MTSNTAQTAIRTSFSEFISPTEELLEEARRGRMFILVDDEDRENEGDLVIPAQFHGALCARPDLPFHDARAG
jgi:3,4-dihydroxy 2-butanone 4-phosphate synthase/GTP cyclohydrolase II